MKTSPLILSAVLGLVAAIPALQSNLKKPQPVRSAETVTPENQFPAETHAEAEAARREHEEATRVFREIGKDHRIPSRENVSGLWKDDQDYGLGLTGRNFQLEQNGEKITGVGYHWGCLGLAGAFRITGTYRNGLLELTFIDPSPKIRDENYTVKSAEQNGYSRLVDSKNSHARFQTNVESQEALKKVSLKTQ